MSYFTPSKRELWERLFIRWLRDKDNYKKYSSYFPKPKGIYKTNGIFKRSYSTNSIRKVDKVDLTVVLDDGRKKDIKNQVNPWFVTGFADAEASFMVIVTKDSRKTTGWRVRVIFSISLHKNDLDILLQIKSYFGGVGNIIKERENSLVYRVYNLKQITTVILHHFDNFPLITQKRADYLLFNQVVKLMENGTHLTLEGLERVLALKASLNKGLTPVLKAGFPHVIPVTRPSVLEQKIPNSYWLAGFTSGEGCFDISVVKSRNVEMRFRITQHVRDEALLVSLISYLGCGHYSKSKGNNYGQYKSSKFSDILNNIIPFFKQYPVLGVKAEDFEDWCKVADIIKAGNHLTSSGLAEISQIKKGMNRGRRAEDAED